MAVMGALCPRPPPGGDALSTGVRSAVTWAWLAGLATDVAAPAHGHSGPLDQASGPSARRGRPDPGPQSSAKQDGSCRRDGLPPPEHTSLAQSD